MAHFCKSWIAVNKPGLRNVPSLISHSFCFTLHPQSSCPGLELRFGISSPTGIADSDLWIATLLWTVPAQTREEIEIPSRSQKSVDGQSLLPEEILISSKCRISQFEWFFYLFLGALWILKSVCLLNYGLGFDWSVFSGQPCTSPESVVHYLLHTVAHKPSWIGPPCCLM